MKMLRNVMATLLLIVSGAAFADDYSVLTIENTDGSASYSISSINKITFDESNMILNMTNGTQQTLPLANLSKMFFGTSSSGITTVDAGQSKFMLRDGMLYVEGQQEGNITIYDVNGKAVRSVTANEAQKGIDVSGMVKGIYIVKAGAQGKKFMNK